MPLRSFADLTTLCLISQLNIVINIAQNLGLYVKSRINIVNNEFFMARIKFGHEDLVNELLEYLNHTPLGKMSVCLKLRLVIDES